MFKYSPFSKKQLQLLSWWTPNSKVKDMNGIVAEGAVRSGKTLIMSLSYIFWSMSRGSGFNYAICGKTVASTRRNIIDPLKEPLRLRGYKVIDKKADNQLIISHDGNINTYHIFGGRDESSASLIQGITLAGILFDEVAIQPQSFIEQGLARCSVEGSKFWFNCNPEGPRHWFKVNYINQAKQRKLIILHFMLEDNLSLAEDIIERYKTMFTGIFYRRFILGEWAFADGIVYADVPDECFYENANKKEVLPIKCIEGDISPMYAADYGTTNPMVYLKVFKYRKPGELIPYFYIEDEYYWDSKAKYKQKTDSEYVKDFETFVNKPIIPNAKSNGKYKFLIIDPSAESLRVAHQRNGHKVMKAKNDVHEGISMVATLFAIGHIKINRDNCPNLVAELGLYQWDSKKAENGKDEVVKANDHACDALRYAIYTTTPKYELYGDIKGRS